MKPWKEYGRYGSVGIELVLSMLIGMWLGNKADHYFNTAPYLACVGFLVGVYAGFRALFATASHMQRDIERAERVDRGEDPWAEEKEQLHSEAPPTKRNHKS